MARQTAFIFLVALCQLAASSQANPTHYGDPKGGCESDEEAVQVQGVSGNFCTPQCSSSGSCPSDVPSGVTAAPQCALQTTTGQKYCALICQPSVKLGGASGECGTGTCQSIQGIGLCTYSSSEKSAERLAASLSLEKQAVDLVV
mmetsp:Transcript_11856/g.27047  ORF Transcript_11856/g.27047 Transcript_11856/m.27047 type:complete len:145 (-) Transcript_11856:146-580(-)